MGVYLLMSITYIAFVNRDGEVVCEYKLLSLPLKEVSIIEKSIEMFNDSEPCIIHRTYVMKKIYFEIEEYLQTLITQGANEVNLYDMPKKLIQPLEVESNITKLYFK